MMYQLQIVTLLVVLNGVVLTLQQESDHSGNVTCPTWTTFDASTGTCRCGHALHNIVSCVHANECETQVEVLVGFCMTLNYNQTEAVVGSCPYNVRLFSPYRTSPMPCNLSNLDADICGYTNRTGQLCGKCVNGTSPSAYSYYLQCVSCPQGTNNWVEYLAVSLLPTTALFLGALLLRFRATAQHLNGYILLCQIITSPNILRRRQESYFVHHYEHNPTETAANVYFSCLSVWNLDFFRLIYPPFCLHPNASILQVLSLQYITAAYPLVLIMVTYLLVTLYYYNCRLVVCLWRPFLRCCIRFQRQWDIRNSLVDAFATFLLLSYVKFLSVSFDILAPTIVWNDKGIRQRTMLYYDGTVGYFSMEHLPYAILALSVLLVLIFLPILLLCLYPCRCFQKWLNRCHLRSQILHMFMETFQGCYKDGTNGTRDCRYFAAVYLITRVAAHLSFVFSFLSFTNSVFTALFAVVVTLLSVFHPYKIMLYNQLDIIFVVCVWCGLMSMWIRQHYTTTFQLNSDSVIFIALAPIPIIYPLYLFLYHIWKKSRRLQDATVKVRGFFTRSESYRHLAESLPRRVTMAEASQLHRRERNH